MNGEYAPHEADLYRGRERTQLHSPEPLDVHPVPIGDSDEVSVGDPLFVVGAPLGQAQVTVLRSGQMVELPATLPY